MGMLSSELSVAAIENNVDAFDGLIKKGCDPNYNDTVLLKGEPIFNSTPLYLAAYYLNMGNSYLIFFVRIILQHIIFAFSEFLEKILTVKGVDVNVRTSDGYTALQTLIHVPASKFEMMRMLVNAGADLEARNSYGNTAACIAVMFLEDSKNPPLKVSFRS